MVPTSVALHDPDRAHCFFTQFVVVTTQLPFVQVALVEPEAYSALYAEHRPVTVAAPLIVLGIPKAAGQEVNPGRRIQRLVSM